MLKLMAFIYHKRVIIAKYLISGSAAASVQLSLLYFLTSDLRFHYLLSSTIAFFVAMSISFTLQKFWTFGNTSLLNIRRQATLYFLVALTGLAANAAFMSILIEDLHFWYLFSQILTSGTLAVGNFLLYNLHIFRTDTWKSIER
jgi:putative flippase GtrA